MPPKPAERRRLDLVRLVRAIPIRWRILSIAVLNTGVVIVLAGLIWNGAMALSRAWDEVRAVRESDSVLVLLEGEAGRLQNLIHRYINEPSPEILAEILLVREAVLGTLRSRKPADPMLASGMDGLAAVTEKFLDGFGELRAVQTAINRLYDAEVLRPAREMAGLYSIVEGAAGRREALIWPALGKSREAFTAALVGANAYYLSLDSSAADEARRNLETIERTIPVMSDLASDDMQRAALEALGGRAAAFRDGLAGLSERFAARTHLLRTVIDGNQASMISLIDTLQSEMRRREARAQAMLDRTLKAIYRQVVLVAAGFLIAIMVGAMIVTRSIRSPLKELMSAMHAIVAGHYGPVIRSTSEKDEIGAMARAVEVFRENAIAKRQAENDLRTAKDNAEKALAELRAAQKSLIDAEKLAALGGLVAGVAHEVNNPVGISLTVASSLVRRSEVFAEEIAKGPLRRSRLDDFVAGTRDAARQLVGNLQRAGELIQSFKQVAVDRSHAELRDFDLREATEQIAASVRPVLRKAQLALVIEVPDGIVMDSYPGSYGQVLTNLFLNSVAHGFPDGRTGTIEVRARQLGPGHVEIVVADDGVGMTDDVRRRAFDPFFTTRRGRGGTGLGLHIIHSLVTQSLGGRLTLDTALGHGTTFRMVLPRRVVRADVPAAVLQTTDRAHG
ncbi:histidine kinase [Rhodoplanes elegans]|uniref:histidine kinase n=1 Tax=Rhodoplanes elegans TaxID=29408 RepID=A0A327KAI4_9BRAD|nr:ATP-binding protein [Rhodoplanes elegans]MBK5960831.1 histidine kinase [Rhodoplanes elegans]RAI34665.1 histidine kinase [Rhodoplanes elegans]